MHLYIIYMTCLHSSLMKDFPTVGGRSAIPTALQHALESKKRPHMDKNMQQANRKYGISKCFLLY